MGRVQRHWCPGTTLGTAVMPSAKRILLWLFALALLSYCACARVGDRTCVSSLSLPFRCARADYRHVSRIRRQKRRLAIERTRAMWAATLEPQSVMSGEAVDGHAPPCRTGGGHTVT